MLKGECGMHWPRHLLGWSMCGKNEEHLLIALVVGCWLCIENEVCFLNLAMKDARKLKNLFRQVNQQLFI